MRLSAMTSALHLAAGAVHHARQVPPRYRAEIVAYINDGVRPSQFVSAIIANDLELALIHEEKGTPKSALRAIFFFLREHAPRDCRGTFNHLKAWIKAGGVYGRRAPA